MQVLMFKLAGNEFLAFTSYIQDGKLFKYSLYTVQLLNNLMYDFSFLFLEHIDK